MSDNSHRLVGLKSKEAPLGVLGKGSPGEGTELKISSYDGRLVGDRKLTQRAGYRGVVGMISSRWGGVAVLSLSAENPVSVQGTINVDSKTGGSRRTHHSPINTLTIALDGC